MCNLGKLYSKWKHNPFILFVKSEHMIGIEFMVFHGVSKQKNKHSRSLG